MKPKPVPNLTIAFITVPIMTSCAVCGMGVTRTQTIRIEQDRKGLPISGVLVGIVQEGHRCGTVA